VALPCTRPAPAAIEPPPPYRPAVAPHSCCWRSRAYPPAPSPPWPCRPRGGIALRCHRAVTACSTSSPECRPLLRQSKYQLKRSAYQEGDPRHQDRRLVPQLTSGRVGDHPRADQGIQDSQREGHTTDLAAPEWASAVAATERLDRVPWSGESRRVGGLRVRATLPPTRPPMGRSPLRAGYSGDLTQALTTSHKCSQVPGRSG
jgi:hypothetical protein